ncbi:DUF29 domain-containing protein [Nodosilinea sp. E11]|uniref:DUF29 domain-containing protein n=1 Tax=Nodosilinea sp. E11 TaxID=3037479 RepID=UPI0029342F0D|nr:DUF29 domain-containing protein [Nodosilinea sp. E11]WOD41107.1 DUF29 domain-containing protein [Nodosilinea sp. E11]
MPPPEASPDLEPSAATSDISNLYESDFYAWVQQQASFLRAQQWHHIDLPNLIEEIESLGKQQRQELRSRLSVLLAHLLNWHFQPQHRSRSWLATLRVQRRDILRLLNENPSLKPDLEEALTEAYANSRDLAMGETNLPEATFPLHCPYCLADIFAEDFYPGEPSDLLND